MIPIVVELNGESAEKVVEGVVAAMRAAGLVVPAEGRMRPFSVPELVEETGLCESMVRKLIEAGTFVRVQRTGRLLVTVASVRAWQAGGEKKGGGR